MENLTCPWDPAKYLILSENVPTLLYYSHVPAMIFALILGIVILSKNHKALPSILLFLLMTSFVSWGLMDLILWATNSPAQSVFWWSLQVLIEPLIYVFGLLFLKTFIDKKNFSFLGNLLIGILLLPLVLGVPTEHNVAGVYLVDCVAVEGFIALYYAYFLEILFSIGATLFVVRRYRKYKKENNKTESSKTLLIGSGIILFLLAFSYGNIVGSITLDWAIAQFGLLGMPVFLLFLGLIIVKYQSFNIRLLGTQALVWALWILVFGLLFINNFSIIRIIIGVTLLLLAVVGYLLIKGYGRDAKQREEITKLAEDLKVANVRLKELDRQKSEFVSLASHQLRSPLTAINGYVGMLIDGDYGKISKDAIEALGKVQIAAQDLSLLVGDYLDVTRIELGRMKYNFEDFSISEMVKEVIDEVEPVIEKKQLKLESKIPKDDLVVHADRNKLKQVMLNLVDNSIKYTPEGSLTIVIEKIGNKARFSVTDTGIGIANNILPNLFEKFVRAPGAHKINIGGAGLGLFVGKKIMTEHKGRIWAESLGLNKGSTFSFEIDLK